MTDTVCGTVKIFCFALDFPTTPTYGTNETFTQHCHIKTMKKHMRLAPQTKFPNANETRGLNKSFHFFLSKLRRFQKFNIQKCSNSCFMRIEKENNCLHNSCHSIRQVFAIWGKTLYPMIETQSFTYNIEAQGGLCAGNMYQLCPYLSKSSPII